MRKLISSLVVLAVLLLAGGLLWWRLQVPAETPPPPAPPPPPRPIQLEFAEIRRGTIRDLRRFTGTVMPRPQQVIAPSVPGRLKEIVVVLGQSVRPGERIAQVTDDEPRQQVEMAQSALTVSQLTVQLQQLSLDLSERKRERLRQLWEQRIASEMAWDDAEANYTIQAANHKMAVARMKQSELELRWAEKRLAATSVVVPLDIGEGAWFVSALHVEAGAMMMANMPLASVVDLARVVAVFHALEHDYAPLRLGQEATILCEALPDAQLTGKILSIAPGLREESRGAMSDDTRHQARIEIEIPNEKFRLRPGMSIQAWIEMARQDEATILPRAALVEQAGREGVFLAVDGTARFVPVTPGMRTAEQVAIGETELAGRTVVTAGHEALRDGETLPTP